MPLLAPLLLATLAACAGTPAAPAPAGAGPGSTAAPPGRDYRGELDLWLLPYDEIGACSVTVGLRNASGVRQGEAWLTLAWLGADGSELAPPARIRMDPLLPGRYNAKNETLPLRCAEVIEVELRGAEWTLFAGWDAPPQPRVPIAGISGTRWRLAWSEEQQAWGGERIAP